MRLINIVKGQAGPNPGFVAVIFAVLFNFGLYQVVTFTGGPHFPGPWESVGTLTAYFQAHGRAASLCAFLHFGAAIPLGIFTATMVSRLQLLGIRVAGIYIALFGGLATAFNMIASSSTLWVMACPGIASNPDVLRVLYYLMFAFGGFGFSVPLGLLIAGISIPCGFMKLLPKWLVIFGIALAVIGELSWLDMITPRALFLIPLTRFPAFLWLILAGFMLPRNRLASQTVASQMSQAEAVSQ